MNKVTLTGNLGKNPDMSYTNNGTAVTKFSLAVTRFSRQGGQSEKVTDWYNVTAWGKLAETTGQYLQKGSRVLISGRLALSKYTGKDGVERISPDVTLEEMEMLSNRNATEGSSPAGHAPNDFMMDAPGDDLDDHPF